MQRVSQGPGASLPGTRRAHELQSSEPRPWSVGATTSPTRPIPYCGDWAPGMSRDWQGAPLQPLKDNGLNFVDFSRQQYVQDVLEVIEGSDGE